MTMRKDACQWMNKHRSLHPPLLKERLSLWVVVIDTWDIFFFFFFWSSWSYTWVYETLLYACICVMLYLLPCNIVGFDLSSLRRLNQFIFPVLTRCTTISERYKIIFRLFVCFEAPSQLIWVPHTSSPGNFSLPHHISGPPAPVRSMFHRVVRRFSRCWCDLTPLAVRLSVLDCCSPQATLWLLPYFPLPISSIPLSSPHRITYSQAEWCRDGREKHDLLIRCSWEDGSLGNQPEGGKSHTGNSNPGSESRLEHVLMIYLCGCVIWMCDCDSAFSYVDGDCWISNISFYLFLYIFIFCLIIPIHWLICWFAFIDWFLSLYFINNNILFTEFPCSLYIPSHSPFHLCFPFVSFIQFLEYVSIPRSAV